MLLRRRGQPFRASESPLASLRAAGGCNLASNGPPVSPGRRFPTFSDISGHFWILDSVNLVRVHLTISRWGMRWGE